MERLTIKTGDFWDCWFLKVSETERKLKEMEE